MSHLESEAGELFYQQDNSITIQKLLSTIAVLVLVYYLQQYLTYETTIQRTIYEFATWLVPDRFIRLTKRMLGGGTAQLGFIHHGSRQAPESERLGRSSVTGMSSIVQKARTFSGMDRILPQSTEISFSGLGNLDNSCYQNSVLQALASLDSFQQFIDTSAEQSQTLRTAADTQFALYNFLEELRLERAGRSSTWTPRELKAMDSWQQQDAQEYFSKIMDTVEKENIRACQAVNQRQIKGLESLKDCLADSEEGRLTGKVDQAAIAIAQDTCNPVDGLLAQRLVCQSCRTSEGVSLNPFNCLTLNLESASSTHLEDLITSYTNFEILEGIECDECTRLAHSGLENETPKPSKKSKKKKKSLSNGASVTPAEVEKSAPKLEKVRSTKAKEIRLGRLPQSLVFHINRNIFDMYGNQRKNSSAVSFPLRLEVLDDWVLSFTSEFQDVHAVYELKCVVSHYGRHDNGHYIACGKRGKGWYEFNDAKVRRIEEEVVLACGNVFMLFYEMLPMATLLDVKLENDSCVKDLSAQQPILGIDNKAPNVLSDDTIVSKEHTELPLSPEPAEAA